MMSFEARDCAVVIRSWVQLSIMMSPPFCCYQLIEAKVMPESIIMSRLWTECDGTFWFHLSCCHTVNTVPANSANTVLALFLTLVPWWKMEKMLFLLFLIVSLKHDDDEYVCRMSLVAPPPEWCHSSVSRNEQQKAHVWQTDKHHVVSRVNEADAQIHVDQQTG